MALRKMDYASERKFVFDARFPFLDLTGLIAIVTASVFVLLLLIPLPLVPPVLSILSFAIACAAALYAFSAKAARDAQGITSWDIASLFTCIWIVTGILSDRKYLLDWFDNLSVVP